MAKSNVHVGGNIREILEDVSVSLAARFFENVLREVPDTEIDLTFPADAGDDPEARLPIDFLKGIEAELLAELEYHSQRVSELSETKGAQSLRTVILETASNEECEVFEQQLDDISRSCWAFVNLPWAFQNAESFHHARKDRDRGKIYSAFSLDLDEVIPASSETIDLSSLTSALIPKLELRKEPRLSAIDLAATSKYPASVMLIVRHGGDLSSVYAHREDGSRKPLYYRPQDEIILIYTAKEHRIEVVGTTFGQRHIVSNAFAEMVLGQNISEKPLSEKVYDLGRFTTSFELEIPDIDDVEILSAVVTECELLLGSFGRRVSLKVTRDDDIDNLANRYLAGALKFRGASGIYRVGISVEYRRTEDSRKRSMNITVRGTNGSNIQTHKDRNLRDLGARLLKSWGIMRALKPLDHGEAAEMVPGLMRLFDLGETIVTGMQVEELGLSLNDLLDARLVSQKSRQSLTLIDEDDDVVEAEVNSKGSGDGRSAQDFTEFKVADPWLRETLAKAISAGLDERRFEIVGDDLLRLGKMNADGSAVPVFLARRLDVPKVIDGVEAELQLQSGAVSSLVLSAGVEAPRFLGSHVVIPVSSVWRSGSEATGLDVISILERYRADSTLKRTTVRAKVIKAGTHSGSFLMPEKDPLPLSSSIQIAFFEKLATAFNSGTPELHASYLVEGTSARTPRELFTGAKRAKVFDIYVTKGSQGGMWRLKD